MFTIKNVDVLNELKNDPNVLFLDIQRKPHTEGNFDLVNPAINKINQARNAYPEIHGEGYNVSIKEEAFDETDIDLKGRSFRTSVTPSTLSQHATIMAVLVGGAGNSSSLANGVVNKVMFTSSDFNNLMPDDNNVFTDNNIWIQNHSYGVGIENYYGNEAFAYDQQVSDHPTLVHIFSSGNIGPAKPTVGTYKDLPFSNLTGTFKQSKNVLVVSAIDTSLQVNALNSRGPAFDGRLKPELTAYGPGGTSDAAALITGTATMIQEKYQKKYHQLPEVSMVKAILIASADDVGAKGIDFVTGYGNINAYKALQLVDQNQLFQVVLSQQDQISFPIKISSGVSQIKIAVSWTDPPADVNSSVALINDIDSWLESGSDVFQPWVLSSYPHPDSLTAPATRKPDHLNNAEYITIDSPPAGNYQLVLRSGPIKGDSQKVSIAYYGDKALDFSWTFPVASDIVRGGIKNLLVWNSEATQPGDLYVQFNSGAWQLIGQQLNLQTPYTWDTPDILAMAKLKVKIGSNDFLSDEFVISPQLELKTIFNCADSLGLSWNKVNNATGYDVFALGDQYLERIQSTLDTVMILKKTASSYFAVVPKLKLVSGLKSGTIDYSIQGSFCYLNFFSANRIKSSEIEVRLSLSTFHGIQSVMILKSINGFGSVFKNITSPELNHAFADLISEGGTYVYQAKIVFNNGSTLLSDPQELIIENPGKAVIWPNPITQNDYLNIISEGNATLRIFNQIGQTIFEKKLTLLNEELDIDPLPAGLYVYQLLNDRVIMDTGRLIKL